MLRRRKRRKIGPPSRAMRQLALFLLIATSGTMLVLASQFRPSPAPAPAPVVPAVPAPASSAEAVAAPGKPFQAPAMPAAAPSKLAAPAPAAPTSPSPSTSIPAEAAEDVPAAHYPPEDLIATDDALTIRLHSAEIRLAGLDDLPRTTVCLDAGQMWGCGQQARVALYNLVRGHAIDCTAGRRLPGRAISANCRVGGTDLATAQVAGGWARPAVPGTLQAEMEAARQGNLGLWRGNWTLKAP